MMRDPLHELVGVPAVEGLVDQSDSARIAMGASIEPRRQASLHGAAHTRPHTDANGLGARATRNASSSRPSAMSWTYRPASVATGQPAWHLTCAFQWSRSGSRTEIAIAVEGCSRARWPVMTNVIETASFSPRLVSGRRCPTSPRAELPRHVGLRERAQRGELGLVKARGECRRHEIGRFLGLHDERHLDARQDAHGEPHTPYGVPEIGEDLAHVVHLGARRVLERAADRGTEDADGRKRAGVHDAVDAALRGLDGLEARNDLARDLSRPELFRRVLHRVEKRVLTERHFLARTDLLEVSGVLRG